MLNAVHPRAQLIDALVGLLRCGAGGLRSLIRNPKAVRTWPQQQMPGFDETMLREADLDALIAYLTHMAAR